MSRLWKGIWITGALTVVLAVLAVLTLIVGVLTGFTWPTHDQSVLKAIKADALILMDTRSAKNNGIVPESQWPPAIASLKPAFVMVFPPDTVDIVTKPFFDGGWGYRVLRNEREAPQPAGRFSELGHGVYWFHPY